MIWYLMPIWDVCGIVTDIRKYCIKKACPHKTQRFMNIRFLNCIALTGIYIKPIVRDGANPANRNESLERWIAHGVSMLLCNHFAPVFFKNELCCCTFCFSACHFKKQVSCFVLFFFICLVFFFDQLLRLDFLPNCTDSEENRILISL